MQVSELARAAGVTPEVVRYYTRRGLLCPARRAGNGYRAYRRADVQRLRFIRRARSLGFTLAEIGQILEAADRRESPCPQVRALIVRRIAETRQQLEATRALLERMEHAARVWRTMPDRVPDGEHICHLIEAVTAADGSVPGVDPDQGRTGRRGR